MLFLRSLLFNVLFYVNLAVIMVLGLPTVVFGRRAIIRLAHAWAWSSFWLMEKICGTRVEFRGVENLLDCGCIVAAKHQSVWETFALTTRMRDFTYILKRELIFLPLFGLYLLRADQIAINRQSRSAALRQLMDEAGKAIAEGRTIFIFPEGTRRPAGRRQPIRAASRISMPRPTRPACRSRSIPACSGRAANFCAGREPLSWSFCRPFPRDCRRRNSRKGSKRPLKRRATG